MKFFKSIIDKWKKVEELPRDVLFLDQYGNYVTWNGIRSSKTIEEHFEIEMEELRNGSTILDNVKD